MNSIDPIQFEGQYKSWLGTYQEAKGRNYAHLESDCTICLNDFVDADQLIVLPCSHGFHERCFSDWDKQICPLDKGPADVVEKVTVLGTSLLIPPKARTLPLWSSVQAQKNSQDALKNILAMGDDADLGFIQEEIKFFFPLLQDFINAFSGLIPEEEISATAFRSIHLLLDGKNMEDLVKKLGCSMQEYDEKRLQIQNFLEGTREILMHFPQVDHVGHPIDFYERGAQFIEQVLVHQGVNIEITVTEARPSIKYLSALGDAYLAHPSVKTAQEGEDRRFVSFHFKAIRAIETVEEKEAYLKGLSTFSLERLNRLAGGGGPTSLVIKKVVKDKEIENMKLEKIFFGLILAVCSALFLAMD